MDNIAVPRGKDSELFTYFRSFHKSVDYSVFPVLLFGDSSSPCIMEDFHNKVLSANEHLPWFTPPSQAPKLSTHNNYTLQVLTGYCILGTRYTRGTAGWVHLLSGALWNRWLLANEVNLLLEFQQVASATNAINPLFNRWATHQNHFSILTISWATNTNQNFFAPNTLSHPPYGRMFDMPGKLIQIIVGVHQHHQQFILW